MERLSRVVREHLYTELGHTAAIAVLRRCKRGQARRKPDSRWLVSCSSIVCLAVSPAVASAQSPIVLHSAAVIARGLPSPGKAFAELKDGRLLTHSAADRVVLLIDPRRGTFDTLGREGHGPGEHVIPLASGVLTDGRIALVDLGNLRLTSWKADKKLDSIVAVPAFALHFDADLDAEGRVYWGDFPANSPAFQGPADRRGRHPDSTWLYRLNPPSTRYDTVASLIHQPAAWIGSTYKLPLLYGARDVWGVLRNGTIWIARARENRIDRLSHGGRWRLGTPRPWVPVPTSEADVRMARDLSRSPRDSLPRPMAKHRPPFDYAVASDEGEVWTHQSRRPGVTQELFAVFPPTGPSLLTVSLPARRRLVRISRVVIYAMAEDEDGSWILEQYRRPH